MSTLSVPSLLFGLWCFKSLCQAENMVPAAMQINISSDRQTTPKRLLFPVAISHLTAWETRSLDRISPRTFHMLHLLNRVQDNTKGGICKIADEA